MSRIVSLPAAAILATALSAGAAMAAEAGEAMFVENCSACHQSTGQGIPGAFPALAGNAFVQGPAAAVVGVVLNGRGGMPSFRNDLSDEQISGILSYVRSAWGNKAEPLAKDQVASVRTVARVEDPAAALQAH